MAAETALLDMDGQVAPVDLVELEEEVRRGRIPATARLRHGPWTGEGFLPLDRIPALAEALDSQEACFVAHLRRWRFPWGTTLMTGVVAAAGITQLYLQARGSPDSPLAHLYDLAPVGYDELLMDGHWWTPWSSQLSHGGPLHLFPNLLVLGWMGYRVERALGTAALAFIGACSVALGTLAITWLEDLPAIGSSVLGFGLWGAVLAIGFRWGDTLQLLRVRGRYGYGNLPVFAMLYAGSLGAAAASQAGHLGGLLGGVGAAMVVSAESLQPRRRRARAWLANGVLALLVAALPCLVGPVLGRVPALSAERRSVVEAGPTGTTLNLPRRMLANPRSLLGMPAWTTSTNSAAALFDGLVGVPRDGDLPQLLQDQWAEALHADLAPAAPPPDPGLPGTGWLHLAWTVSDPETGQVTDRVVEHVLPRGHTALRVGYRLEGAAVPAREALYVALLGSLRVGDPEALEQARADHDRNPASPRLQYALARELLRLSHDAEADALLGTLADRDDAWAWDAARLRLALWDRQAQAQGRDFEGGGEALIQAQRWVEGWLDRAPPADDGIHQPGIDFLARTGACASARAHAELLTQQPESHELGQDLETLALACE